MSHTVKDAKNNLSSLIRLAEKGEPQIIRRNETEVAVVVSIEDWKKLNGKKESLVEFLQKSSLDEIIPYFERDENDFPREVSLQAGARGHRPRRRSRRGAQPCRPALRFASPSPWAWCAASRWSPECRAARRGTTAPGRDCPPRPQLRPGCTSLRQAAASR